MFFFNLINKRKIFKLLIFNFLDLDNFLKILLTLLLFLTIIILLLLALNVFKINFLKNLVIFNIKTNNAAILLKH